MFQTKCIVHKYIALIYAKMKHNSRLFGGFQLQSVYFALQSMHVMPEYGAHCTVLYQLNERRKQISFDENRTKNTLYAFVGGVIIQPWNNASDSAKPIHFGNLATDKYQMEMDRSSSV